MSKIIGRIKEDFSILEGNLLILIISWILMRFGDGMAYPFQSPYIQELGASPTIIGFIWSIGLIILFFVRIPGSYIADRYGRRGIIVLMTYGVALSYVFYVIAPDWRFILIGVVLMNLCLIYQPALEAITADSIPPDKRGLGFALTRIVPETVGIISPFIGGYITYKLSLVNGMRTIYAAIVILSILAASIRYAFLRETLDTKSRDTHLSLKNLYIESVKSMIEAWKEAPKTLKYLTVVLMLSSFEDPIYMNFASLYVLERVKVTELEWGSVNTLYAVSSLIAGIPMGKLVDKIGRRNSILVSYIIFTPLTLWFIYSHSAIELAIIFIGYGIGSILIGPAFNALTADLVPKELRGRVMGAIGNLNILASAVSSMISGILYDLDPALPFFMSLAIGITCLSMVILFIKEPCRRMD